MLQQIAQLIRDNRGQGIVEFAIVLPLLLMIVLGVINFGFVMYQTLTANEAAREAARVTVVTGDRSQGIATARKFNPNFAANITPSKAPSAGDQITVVVSVPAIIFAPGYQFSGLPSAVKATTYMRMETGAVSSW